MLWSGPSGTLRLLLIPAGQAVPEHGHRGLELTLVLSGAFSDATGHFQAGDLEVADEALGHTPHATDEVAVHLRRRDRRSSALPGDNPAPAPAPLRDRLWIGMEYLTGQRRPVRVARDLGSGTHNQKMTVAAMQMALMKVWAQRSYRVAMRRQSLSLPNIRSMRLRCL